MAPKRIRPRIYHFVVDDLISKWQEILNLRDPGFHWDGSSFDSKATDYSSLEKYRTPLQGLLELAPSGFPSHVDVRSTFAKLQKRYGIFSSDNVVNERALDESTAAWRLMAKQIYNLKKNDIDIPSLRNLTAIIKLPGEVPESSGGDTSSSRGTSSERPPPEKALNLEDVEQLYNVGDNQSEEECYEAEDVECQMLSMTCHCPECAKMRSSSGIDAIIIDDEGDDKPLDKKPAKPKDKKPAKPEDKKPAKPEDKTPAGAIPVPNPIAGKQRFDTTMVPKVRFKSKRPLTIPNLLGVKPTKPMKSAKKQSPTSKKKVGLDPKACIPMPISIVHRKTSEKAKLPEAYLMAGGKFLAAQSSAKCASYLENAKELKIKIEAKEVRAPEAAKKWLEDKLE
eukprot:3347301-Pyramimonas_sp.AAC.1